MGRIEIKRLLIGLMKSPLWQFIKFCAVGATNTIVNLAVYYLIIFINADLYIVAYVIAWAVSVLNAFLLSNRFVFGTSARGKEALTRLAKTYLAYGATLILTTVLLHLEVEILGVSKVIAPLINVVLCIPLNFLLNKFWAFAKKR